MVDLGVPNRANLFSSESLVVYGTTDASRVNISGNSLQFSLPLSEIDRPTQKIISIDSVGQNTTFDTTERIIAVFSSSDADTAIIHEILKDSE